MNRNNFLRIILAGLIICVLVISSVGTVSAATQSTFVITDFSMYPETLMPGESGIVTVTLENTGTTFAPIDQIYIKDADGITSTVSQYQNPIGGVGAGDTITLSLPITSDGKTGTFYPVVYVDFINAGDYLKYPFPVIVDDQSVVISVISRPDVFEAGTTQTVVLSIGNPRTNAIEGVQVSASGEGVTSKQTSVFLGEIAENSAENTTLSVTTSDETSEVTFDVKYRNGATWHTESLTVPLESGISKTGAELIINNFEVTENSKGYYTIIGDVNNAGLTTAKTLVVTYEGATEAGPYTSYVVGSLDEDGLSEFELSFKDPVDGKITLIFSYKDTNGNVYTVKEGVSVYDVVTGSENSGEANPIATILIVIVILVILAGGFVAWKKGKIFARK
ncbi:MAG TPA: hypothetical protein VJY43_05385 [Methanocorpusculum sp.]|nr:hypothetical protein [Methanocorpusculum sp.]